MCCHFRHLHMLHIVMLILFATVPGSSINSWDSWFIFNLWKINTCYYMNTARARKRTVTIGNNSMYILNNVYLELWFSNKHISWKEDWIYSNAYIRIIHHIRTSYIELHYIIWNTRVHPASLLLLLFLAGWLPSVHYVRYKYVVWIFNPIDTRIFPLCTLVCTIFSICHNT